MHFTESDKEEPSWSAHFWRSFPAHTRLAFSAADAADVIFAPFFVYGILGAPVVSIVFLALGWLKGYSFSGGWALSAFVAFGFHMSVCALVAAWSGTDSFLYYRSRHREWVKHSAEKEAELQKQQREERVARQRREAEYLLDELIEAARERRLAPARAAQARAQRLTLLEAQLNELFNRYRFSCDATGTGDMNMLRRGFWWFLQANPYFSADDMALLSTSGKSEVKALLPKPKA